MIQSLKATNHLNLGRNSCCTSLILSNMFSAISKLPTFGSIAKLAIARSLANDPEIILADEPTGNLDTKTGLQIISFLQELNEQGKTIIIVTHDPDVAKYGKKIYHLKDGMIQK